MSDKANCLVVIEDGQLKVYELDDRLAWEVGRPSADNVPDIKLHSLMVSRKHGRFQNIDGMWFYLDHNGKNGTVYNGKHVTAGLRGRVKPVTVKHGDVFIFGGGETPVIDKRTVWAMFTEKKYGDGWRVEDTGGLEKLSFTDGKNSTKLDRPEKGTVIEKDGGIAVYMGDITYLTGEIMVSGR